MKKIIEYSEEMEIREIYKLAEEGYEFICPKCKVKLNVALSSEEAKEKKLPTGLFCPANPSHVYDSLTFNRKSFWDGFKEEVKDLELK
jgi:hypothetical protein